MKKLELIKEYITVSPKEGKRKNTGEGLKPALKRFWEEWFAAKKENPGLKFSNWKADWRTESNKKAEIESEKKKLGMNLDKEMEEIQEKIKEERGENEEPSGFNFLPVAVFVVIIAIIFLQKIKEEKEKKARPKYRDFDVGGGKTIKIPIQ